ncbi:MAG: Gfo/Idh/MocA family oxidoreductase [Spirochaetales bacterium]|nr:Gfo/Idh/MocA family oxidoreductase [Spirochaetales bacterium]
MITIALVGKGWRSRFIKRITASHPDLFKIGALIVKPEADRKSLEEEWGCPVFSSLSEMKRHSQCLFVFIAVPREFASSYIKEAVLLDLPVLVETPPASSYEELIDLYNFVQSRQGFVQVAEQYFLQPLNQARLNIIEKGLIGSPSQAQVSAGHEYHGISLIRKFLNVGFEMPDITVQRFCSPLVEPRNRDAYPPEEKIINSEQLLCHLSYKGKLGVLDFDENQYFSPIRNSRFLIRGERGEIQNRDVSYLLDYKTSVQLTINRSSLGIEENLEGRGLESLNLGIDEVYNNPLGTSTLADDEIALATALLEMDGAITTGKGFYPLAEGAQDYYLSLLCQNAQGTGRTVVGQAPPWSQ